MAKNKTLSQFSDLAEKVKSKTETPQQTIIPTDELETLKEKAEQPATLKGRRKGVYSFTLSDDVITNLDRLRAEQPFPPSRSEMLEYIVREYVKGK
jgi:hypothetical protein